MLDELAQKADEVGRCILEKTGKQLIGSLEFYIWKHKVVIRDSDIYDTIAKGLGIVALNSKAEPYFCAEINGTPWTFALEGKIPDFVSKYGNEYSFRK